MSFLGGVLEKLEPSERVNQALTRDLEFRRKDERALQRFRTYSYIGSADLILRHGAFRPGRPLPDAYEHLRGPGNECYWNALEAAETDPALTFCEGIYTCGFGHAVSHAWCIAPDGGVLELTMPTRAEELAHALNEARLPYLPSDRWGYYGVTFAAPLVRQHADEYGLPMFDRALGEIDRAEQKGSHGYTAKGRGYGPEDFTDDHDFPLLKVPYNPNRTELP